MAIQEDWRKQLNLIHHVQKEVVAKISWKLIMDEVKV